MSKINVAIIGAGNCFSSLYQGLEYYKNSTEDNVPGVMWADIGGYRPSDIKVVAVYDVDKRKVGLNTGEAIFAKPNCARIFEPKVPAGPIVQMGHALDGVSTHMQEQPEDLGFRVSKEKPVDIVKSLKQSKADILINYLPVGSQKATEFYAQAAIDAGVAFLNCIPVFIASDPIWEQKFIDAKLPIIGDDMRSQLGASVLSQVLQELAFDRGLEVDFHQQLNIGGNSDFNNMMVQSRLASKKKSKENVIRAQNDIRGIPVPEHSLFAGPSTYLPYLKDNKVAYFNLRLRGFGNAPIDIDVKLSVQDSENSAGVVLDAIRYLKVAKELGVVGALRGPSAWTQKTPPQQMMYADAKKECHALANRELTDSVNKQFKK
ncbi:inositol-3-phosphate synthase [Candidatus Saccharibacteria bacterium]|jgi:myo-inositol-1-phosphate synthase|nr:inositol-3-phosphate synthase [Candidatus Saccharibacteria bacterium]MBP7834691.1 inositol-3-phosphate synthase [Candidatus Saccharibacteria bacterium]